MLRLGELSAEAFFEKFWRKQPALFKGASHDVLEFKVTAPWFRSLCDRLERIHPQAVSRGADSLFGQNLDLASVGLRSRSRALEEASSCQRVWFDGVFAMGGGGIGSHYDHSDNLVVQQSGTKLWRLASPDRLTAQELRARMLDDPGAGLVSMPDDCLVYTLEPGDVLYIPLFWAHWGVSVGGPSMSVSAVFNADSALDVLLPLMREVLSEDHRWWTPLPQLCGERAGDPPGRSTRPSPG